MYSVSNLSIAIGNKYLLNNINLDFESGCVNAIIGPNGATDSHVNARLTSTVIAPGGEATIELPQADEDLFLYFVKGNGRFQSSTQTEQVDLYDVVLATPEAETAVIQAGDEPLNYLSFYLKPFIASN